MKNFKISKVIGSFILLLVLGITTYAAGVRYISIATSSAGGAFSIIGTAMSDIINKNDPNVSANIEITGG